MKKYDKQIESLFNKKLHLQKVEVHMKGVEKKLKERYKELNKLEKTLEIADYDVVKLEQLSLRGLFSKILGNKEEQLERTRQVYLLSYLKYHECRKLVEAKEFELKVLKEKLKSQQQVEDKFNKVLSQKKNLIKVKNKTAAKKIILQEFNIRKIVNQQKELQEAIDSGLWVLPRIEALQKGLVEMGSWNFMSGNQNDPRMKITPFYDQKKFVRDRKKGLRETNIVLDNFVDELSDITKKYKIDYSSFVAQLSDFLNRFYDGLITDWIFEQEVKISRSLSIELEDKVIRIIEMLKNDLIDAKEAELKEKSVLESMIMFLEVKKKR